MGGFVRSVTRVRVIGDGSVREKDGTRERISNRPAAGLTH